MSSKRPGQGHTCMKEPICDVSCAKITQIYEGTNQVNARIALLQGAASLDGGRVLTTMLRGLAVMSRYELQRRPAPPAVETGRALPRPRPSSGSSTSWATAQGIWQEAVSDLGSSGSASRTASGVVHFRRRGRGRAVRQARDAVTGRGGCSEVPAGAFTRDTGFAYRLRDGRIPSGGRSGTTSPCSYIRRPALSRLQRCLDHESETRPLARSSTG